jgi:hypothetical protein
MIIHDATSDDVSAPMHVKLQISAWYYRTMNVFAIRSKHLLEINRNICYTTATLEGETPSSRPTIAQLTFRTSS